MTLDQIEGLKVRLCAFKGLLSCQDVRCTMYFRQ